jgi:serine/threonine-protein phosphatase 4 regulatory subunit 1
MLDDRSIKKVYDSEGYQVVKTQVVGFLNKLMQDTDVDVRRSASDSLAGLALHIRRKDIANIILPIPLKLAQTLKKKQQIPPEQESLNEELRITAANLLAELGGAAENDSIPVDLVRESILPAVLSLCQDQGFRARRAAAQALPRVLAGTTVMDATQRILPAFEALSRDDVYRVRKSTGECLVDMSRSLMILAAKDKTPSFVNALRRESLLPIAESLLVDANKFVRHGMMQFLGPFLASFYPFVDSALHTILPGSSESDGSNHSGIVSQFFPHASSMVSRLNSSAAATTSAPTPTLATVTMDTEIPLIKELQKALPPFVVANRSSSVSLKAVVAHRRKYCPDPEDIKAVVEKLLHHFTGLARVSTGDENTDAEMRVYCAYSYPAVVLLLGPENWEGQLKDCFVTLLNPNHDMEDTNEAALPPLPVKRCLASSLHTVAHILGSEVTEADVMPIFRDHFLRDTDESVRLNMIRNFPTLLSLLPAVTRGQYLLQWCEMIRGEEVLGAMKRSATNPLVLNWRQRNYVSRSLSEITNLMDPVFVHTYIWPILKLVLNDSISLVREDAIWTIPILLKCFCADNVIVASKSTDTPRTRELWSHGACQEVMSWLKDMILKSSVKNGKAGSNGRNGNFSQRQLYCQICTSIALAIQFGDGLKDPEDPVLNLESKFTSKLPEYSIEEYGAYRRLTESERSHLVRLLANDMLPIALEFKDDHVTNVRLTLRKTLHLMPMDISKDPALKEAVQVLEEEVETWESFTGMQPVTPTQASVAVPPTKAKTIVAGEANAQNGGIEKESFRSNKSKKKEDGEVKVSRKRSSKAQKKKSGGHANQQVQSNKSLEQSGTPAQTMASI